MINIGSNCIGCTKCVRICPFGALSMDGKKAVVNSACTLCGACIPECPVKCISMPSQTAVKADITAYKGVWVFMEVIEDKGVCKIRPVGYELLTKGRELANTLGEELCAVVIGSDMQSGFAEISSYGADKIYSVNAPGYKDYNTDAYASAMINLINKYKPSIVLYPSTFIGRDLSPRVAAEIHVGLTADCTGLSVNADRNLVQTRPAFGGNIMADILTPNHRPQMATVRPNVMKKEILKPGFSAAVIEESIAINPKAARVKILNKHIDDVHGMEKLDEAEVIISGGRGVKDSNGFTMLKDLANELGGAVGASRAAVDMGFVPKEKQVGQSGVTVRPKLYVACGISGAVQHIVGMDGSDTIIAVNKDPRAPIFNVCKFGIVGDASQILPKVIEEVKKSK
ncbi:Electron transfer flavoprotein alpha subunit [Elusimicrobium minutum Pei191]|uniref:Electron transfer flavoprotein alpha subunit n=1 Tax=Elusimicrobium minutum (strain Pei191) TaxID=445932 RepID=B2KET6_ELUMP|nr:FAD-binding protein [Elusimicrobium minutum]ACC99032.1 Electron transfer flavoprotein alpha subunit [Elusimicrobium minutum Pei191]